MAVYSVDSDAVIGATGAIRGTIERLEGEASALLGQLTQLQSSWTGAAAIGFQSAFDQWRATHRQVEDALGSLSAALASAGAQYAEAESLNASLFR